MVTSLIKSIIQLRRALSSEWDQHKDSIPAAGEPCFVTDKNILKIGDGTTKFSDLEPINLELTGDGKSIVLEDKIFKLIGFDAAAIGAQPVKTKNGIEWIIPVDLTDEVEELQTEMNTTKARMTNAEVAINNINTLVGTKKVADVIDAAVKVEADRAKTAEADIVASVKSEENRAKTAEASILSDVISEKNRALSVEDAIDKRVKTIENDYLKAADKEYLQSQINAMASSPDIENVINSINEFTQYIEEHGEIADGFRTDIDTNKENISDLDARLKAVEESGGGEVNWDDIIGKPEVEAQVQADFAQGDPTAPDYIKNRTHGVSYTGKTLFTEAFDRSGQWPTPSDVIAHFFRVRTSYLTVSVAEFKESLKDGATVELLSASANDSSIPYTSDFTGKVSYYTCTSDGVEYEYYVFGNRYYLSTYQGTFKMDFSSTEDSGDNVLVVVESSPGSESMTIYVIYKLPDPWDLPKYELNVMVEDIIPLDEKYIPDTIARVADIQTLIDNSLGVIENGSY